MIVVGVVMGGLELGGSWAAACVSAVYERLPVKDFASASVSLTYVVPGSVSSAGFEGVRLGRIERGPPAWLDVRIGVPAAELESDRLPDLLLDMAEAAIADVAARYARANITFDPGHGRQVARVRQSVVSDPIIRPPWPRPQTELQRMYHTAVELYPDTSPPDASRVGVSDDREVVRGPFRQSLTLNLSLAATLGERDELERLFAFEDRLEFALKDTGDAELEGNEIGEGSFTFFIVCRSASRTWATVKPMLDELSVLPGSYAELERPGSTRRVDLPSPG